MAGYNNQMRQHQNLARGDGIKGGDDCGCEPLSSVNGSKGEHPDRNISHAAMGDSGRSGPPHISRGGGKLPATAHSDHGPHHIPG